MDNFIQYTQDFNRKIANLTFNDCLELISNSYFTCLIYFHVLYILFYIRCSTPIDGVALYRSYFLGFLMSFSPRLILQIFVPDQINYVDAKYIFYVYSIIWACFNLFPFDLCFKFCRSSRYLVKFLDALSEIINIMNISDFLFQKYESDFLKTLTISMACFISTFVIDSMDQYLNGERNEPRVYKTHHIKRILFFVALYLFISFPGSLEFCFNLSKEIMSSLIIVVYVFLVLIDIAIKTDSVFESIDIIFPETDSYVTYQQREDYFNFLQSLKKREEYNEFEKNQE